MSCNIYKLNLSFYLLIFLSSPKIHPQCLDTFDYERTVVAGGSITEILFFLEAEKYIVGIDVTSNYPQETSNIKSIGYVRNLSTEGILSLNPTLILGEDDMGPPKVLDQLNLTDIDVFKIPENKTLDGIIEKIICVSNIFDLRNIANHKIEKLLNDDIRNLKKNQRSKFLKNKKGILILSMGSGSPMIAGNNTSGNGFIKMIGLTNPFNSFEGWKPVSIESIIETNPDYIFLPSRNVHANESAALEILKNPLLKNIKALKNNNIFYDDAMSMLGFSPRTIQSASRISKEILNNYD